MSVFEKKTTVNVDPIPGEERRALVTDQEIPKIVRTIERSPQRSQGASSPQ